MLCLARRPGERLTITIPPSAEPREITIDVLRGNGAARWGITAPKEINVVRSELLRAEKEKQEHAATHDGAGKECSR